VSHLGQNGLAARFVHEEDLESADNAIVAWSRKNEALVLTDHAAVKTVKASFIVMFDYHPESKVLFAER
jgi:predicted phosphohydrolase